MRFLIPLVMLAHCLAIFIPFLESSEKAVTKDTSIPWPATFEMLPLTRLKLGVKEKAFARDFPGAIARFTDGEREIIMRQVRRPSRQLHPAADCLKGSGYTVKALPIRVDMESKHWGCVEALRAGVKLNVCEIIYDPQKQSWSDMSSWYWAALLNKTEGPWLAVTVSERLT